MCLLLVCRIYCPSTPPTRHREIKEFSVMRFLEAPRRAAICNKESGSSRTHVRKIYDVWPKPKMSEPCLQQEAYSVHILLTCTKSQFFILLCLDKNKVHCNNANILYLKW